MKKLTESDFYNIVKIAVGPSIIGGKTKSQRMFDYLYSVNPEVADSFLGGKFDGWTFPDYLIPDFLLEICKLVD